MIETTLLAVFITGLLGGLHCAGMCGGIVSALSYRSAPAPVGIYPSPSSATAGITTTGVGATAGNCGAGCYKSTNQLANQLLYNTGRLSTYTLLGALAGFTGSVGWWMGVALPLQQAAFFLTNLLLIAMGLYLGGAKWIGQGLEWLGRDLWKALYPRAIRQLKAPGWFSAVSAGALWGLVPCGMLYGVLLAALFSGSAVHGATLMFVFGLGTLPSLLALGSTSEWLRQRSRNTTARKIAGLVVIGFGVLGMLRLDAAENLPLIGQLCTQIPDLSFTRLLR